MEGKKFALILLGIIVAAVLFVVIFMVTFWNSYEPKNSDTVNIDEDALSVEVEYFLQ